RDAPSSVTAQRVIACRRFRGAGAARRLPLGRLLAFLLARFAGAVELHQHILGHGFLRGGRTESLRGAGAVRGCGNWSDALAGAVFPCGSAGLRSAFTLRGLLTQGLLTLRLFELRGLRGLLTLRRLLALRLFELRLLTLRGFRRCAGRRRRARARDRCGLIELLLERAEADRVPVRLTGRVGSALGRASGCGPELAPAEAQRRLQALQALGRKLRPRDDLRTVRIACEVAHDERRPVLDPRAAVGVGGARTRVLSLQQ